MTFRIVALTAVLVIMSACANQRTTDQEREVIRETNALQFDNHCANGLCMKKKKVPCDPTITAEHNGKHYCFSSETAKANFVKDIDINVRNAHEEWDKYGGNSLR
jgi:hypothetical protein